MVPAAVAPVACFSWREIEHIPTRYKSLRFSGRRAPDTSPGLPFEPAYWPATLDEHNYSRPCTLHPKRSVAIRKTYFPSKRLLELYCFQSSSSVPPSTFAYITPKLEMEEFKDLTAYLTSAVASCKNEGSSVDELNTPVFGESKFRDLSFGRQVDFAIIY